jgi:hypothetical protein
MRVVQQTFTEQDVITTLRTDIYAIGSKVANKTTASDKEEVCVIIRQTRKGVEGQAVLLYVFHPNLYMTNLVTDVSLSKSQDNRVNRSGMMNVGLTKTIGDGTERPGISVVFPSCLTR